ncbi:MAG: type II toxin-antitoxin system antitoxin SocA domain-containing protein, partial [Candidatus Paceibacterota bacterium]
QIMIDNIEIGKRIEKYRKQKGWTQQNLADSMGMSRSAITQIEQGNRNVTAPELFQLSEKLKFPVSEIFSSETPERSNVDFTIHKERPVTERISVPSDKVNYTKFKNILLYILEKCAGKPNVGETVLYKLLYFADFNHYEEHEKFLTEAVYRKLPYGPVPNHLDKVFEKMIAEDELQRITTHYFGYPQTRYLPLKKADLEILSGSEKETIDQVIDRHSDWSASAISEYSHKDMPWKATEEGDVIDYELAFYREPPYSARAYDYEEQEEP